MNERVVIVGGGPHGLAVLAALAERPEDWPASVAVVDPHPSWMEAWDDKLGRLLLDRLRSPQVHHPGPRPMQLRDMVEARPGGDQLTLRRPEDERAPTPAGMRAFVDELVADLGPVEWIVGRAAAVELTEPGAAPGDPPIVVRLEDGRELHADRLVLAHNPSEPRLPDWAPPLIDAGLAVHASMVDLRTEPMAGRHVAIVGGGLTAGCLALETVAHGGRVTLLTRGPLRARPYDVDASWLGPRRMTSYTAAAPAERRALIDVARDGGTMPPRTLADLRAVAAEPGSGLVIREAVDVPAELAGLLAEAGLLTTSLQATLGGAGGDAPVTADDDAPQHAAARPIDAIWLATGYENDASTDPLTAPLLSALHVPVHAGLPEVDDDVALPGTRVYVVGPYAALGVGPAARNLAGARPAAARIAAALTRS